MTGLGNLFLVDATSRLFVSGMSPTSLSTLSAHTMCDNSSSAPTLAATLFPRLLALKIASSSIACFSVVVFSVMALTGQWRFIASLALENVSLSVALRVIYHAAARDFAFKDNVKNQTFSASVNLVLISMTHSSQFIKSSGSWSSGFPIKEILDMSAMFTLSGVMMGIAAGEIGQVPWLLSCGVHIAGENENSDDVSVKSSNSAVGELPHVGNAKQF